MYALGPDGGKEGSRISILNLNLSAQRPQVNLPRHAILSQLSPGYVYLCDLSLPKLPKVGSNSVRIDTFFLCTHQLILAYQPGGYSLWLQHDFSSESPLFLYFLKTNLIFFSSLFSSCPKYILVTAMPLL